MVKDESAGVIQMFLEIVHYLIQDYCKSKGK